MAHSLGQQVSRCTFSVTIQQDRQILLGLPFSSLSKWNEDVVR